MPSRKFLCTSRNSSPLHHPELSCLFWNSFTMLLRQAWSLWKCLGATRTQNHVCVSLHMKLRCGVQRKRISHTVRCVAGSLTAGHSLMGMDGCPRRGWDNVVHSLCGAGSGGSRAELVLTSLSSPLSVSACQACVHSSHTLQEPVKLHSVPASGVQPHLVTCSPGCSAVMAISSRLALWEQKESGVGGAVSTGPDSTLA